MLLKSTILVENFNIRSEIMKRIKEIIKLRQNSDDGQRLLTIVNLLAFKIQTRTLEFESRSVQFYEGLTQIFEILNNGDLIPHKEKYQGMIKELSLFIRDREIKEKNTHDVDNLLNGKMKLLRALL